MWIAFFSKVVILLFDSFNSSFRDIVSDLYFSISFAKDSFILYSILERSFLITTSCLIAEI